MQNWPAGYQKKIEDVMGASVSGGRTDMSFDLANEDEAKLLKKKFILMQKQLRQVRKEAHTEMKAIRANYGNQINSVEAGLFSTVFGGAGRDRENQRRKLRNQRDVELSKYQNVKDTIDNILLQIDSAKLQIEELILKSAFDE